MREISANVIGTPQMPVRTALKDAYWPKHISNSSAPQWKPYVNEHGEFREWFHVFDKTSILSVYEYQFAVPWVWPMGEVTMQDAVCMALLGALEKYPGHWPQFATLVRLCKEPYGIVIPRLNAVAARDQLLSIKFSGLSDYRLIP